MFMKWIGRDCLRAGVGGKDDHVFDEAIDGRVSMCVLSTNQRHARL